ncbi:MAG: PQQ-binding-like beta-propeller repeat protein [Phycisphaerae bacterium]|nr:PQQ-binding-like beta-propeller repeat protein [Phycisphaerae bacterium]
MRDWGRFVPLMALTGVLALPAWGTEWPQWRGPFFNGSTDERDLPPSWSRTENVAWVSPLPGPSGATPVISSGRVFVTSTVKGTADFVALCFDAQTGKELWRRQAGSNPRRFPNNNMASPSPVTDGKSVFFLYGDGTLLGFDCDGKELWSRSIEKEYGNLALQFGYSNSPVLYDGRLYITVIRRDKPYREPPAEGPLDSFIAALDPATGKTLWKQPRKTNTFDEGMETYSTPIPFARNGKVELLMTGGDFVTAHDPATGAELWRVEYWTQKVRDSRIIPSLVIGEGLVFGTQHKNKGVYALEPPTREPGRDALATGRIVWESADTASDCSTPLFYDGRLYVLDGLSKKTVTCLDPKTGRTWWQGKLTGRDTWWSSLTAADGRLYCISEAGQIAVIQAGGDEFKILHETQIKEPPIRSSIAIAQGHLFVRTAENLYCIGK